MKPIPKTVTAILLSLFFIGLCVLLYPAISQYWNTKSQSKAIAGYNDLTRSMTEEKLSSAMKTANDYNYALSSLAFPYNDCKTLSGYEEILNVNGLGMMGSIVIDKIKVELPIYHGVSSDILDTACGHLEGSSLPVGGESTHAVLSAHRGLPSAKLFTDLDKLQIGDTFKIVVLGKTLTYQVDRIKIVIPTDISDLQIESGKDYVTLVTCTPYGINTHRLLVRGHRINDAGEKNYYITSEAYQIDRLIVTPIVALPMLLVLILFVIFKPSKRRKSGEG